MTAKLQLRGGWLGLAALPALALAAMIQDPAAFAKALLEGLSAASIER